MREKIDTESTLKAFNSKAWGRAAHPRLDTPASGTLKGSNNVHCSTLSGSAALIGYVPGVRCATPGFVVLHLRRI